MTLRLIEMVVEKKEGEEIDKILKKYPSLDQKQIPLLNTQFLIRILLEAKENEPVLDDLENFFKESKKHRVIVLPVKATLPRIELEGKTEEKVGREEIFEGVKVAAQCSLSYLTMVIISTTIAGIGLFQNNITFVIGAMMVAPLLGPSMALSLGTTLGDLTLLRQAFFTSIFGIFLGIIISIGLGFFIHIETPNSETLIRTAVSPGDIIVALFSGVAAALAFTTSLPATLIGVMVSVALLPPLVSFGMLLGNGQIHLAFGSLSLFLVNIISVNLAGVATFIIQGIHPRSFWEKEKALKATLIAISLWLTLLFTLIGLIFWI